MKKTLGIVMLAVLSLAFSMNIAFAQSNIDLWGGADNKFEEIGFTNNIDPKTTAVDVINLLLTFLGIIAVVLMLWAGFLWMTAAGNDDKISTAKKIMLSAVVGLLIILAAFGIVNWVLATLTNLV